MPGTFAHAARTERCRGHARVRAGDTRACPSTHRAQCEPRAIPHRPSTDLCGSFSCANLFQITLSCPADGCQTQGRLQGHGTAGNACVGSELSCNPGGRSACARLPQCREHTLLPQHPPPTMCVLGTITRAPAPTTHNVTVHAALAYAARTPKGAGDTRACPSTHRAQCEPHAIPHHPSLLI